MARITIVLSLCEEESDDDEKTKDTDKKFIKCDLGLLRDYLSVRSPICAGNALLLRLRCLSLLSARGRQSQKYRTVQENH